ncbi:MAG: tetratricopeptide repeat protein [Flavobacteriales bacterium]|nr:MAG: tetratricopeptide repeat protein [Flavobacteriales bacterium]
MEFHLNINKALGRKPFLIIYMLALSFPFFGQQVGITENARQFLKKSDVFYQKQLYDSAHYYADANYRAIENALNDTLLLSALIQLIRTSHNLPFDQQEAYYDKAEEMATAMGQKTQLIELAKTMGDLFYDKQNFVNAIPYYLKVDSLSKSTGIKNSVTIGAMLNRAEISKLSFTRETTNMAHSLLYEALGLAKQIKAVESEHLAYIQLSDINQMIRDFPEAKKYIDLALPYFEMRDNEKRVSRLNLIKAAYYVGVDSLDKAEQTHLNNMSYLSKRENTLEQANAAYYYGNFLRRKKNAHAEAITPLEAAKELFQKANKDSIELYHRTLRDLAFCNQQIGNYKEASTYYQEAVFKRELSKVFENRELRNQISRELAVEKQ